MALGTSLPSRIPQSSGTRVFYVDAATGSDSNAGTSEGAAWATLQDYFSGTAGPANNIAPTAGDIVYVKNYPSQTNVGGNSTVGYQVATAAGHQINNRSGTALDPITVKAFPGHRPVLRGISVVAGNGVSRCLTFTGSSSYWRFEGLDFPYASGTEISGSESNDPTVYISGTSNNVEFYNCWFHGSTSGSGLTTNTTVGTGVHLINCRFYENDDIRGGTNQSHGIYIQASGALVLNCLMYDHLVGAGIQLRSGASNNVVANCVAYSNGQGAGTGWGYVIEPHASDTDTNKFVNCIAQDNQYGFRQLAGTAATGNRAFKNIAYSNTTLDLSNAAGAPSGSLDFSAGGTGDTTGPGDNLTSDPLLTNAAGFVFTLQAGSPAYNAGAEAYCPTFDHNGTTRTVPTIGAYVAPEEVATTAAPRMMLMGIG